MYQHKMNKQTEEVFQKVHRKVSNLYSYLQLYKQVYGSEEAIEVINDSANSFFALNQSIFIDNLILSITRLTDPAKMGNYENLTLPKLLELIENDENSSEDLIDRLNELLINLKNVVEPLKTHRDKRIAHFDLEVIKNGTASLPDFENSLYEAIEYLEKFMNEIFYLYQKTQHDYEILFTAGSDGSALIHQLIKGKAYQELEDDGKVENEYWMNIYPDLP